MQWLLFIAAPYGLNNPGCHRKRRPGLPIKCVVKRQAREAGYKVKIGKFPYGAASKATILGAREGFVKVVCDERYGEILGVHIIGPRATETIAEAVMAMRLEGTVDDIAHTIHAHPTLAEALGEAAHAAVDWPIHI